MSLNQLRDNWDRLAATDPWRAILGRPGEGKGWDAEEFFASGVREIDEAMRRAEELGHPLERRRALDFGCGAGRLTQGLANHCEQVVGVDVSPAMVELAGRHNRRPEHCQYVHNQAGDLRRFDDDSFDLVYSNITLQHIRSPLARSYMREFLRLLSPGGLLLFHLPSHRRSPLLARWLPGDLYTHLSRLFRQVVSGGKPVIEMHGMRRTKVLRLLEGAGGRVLSHEQQPSAGSDWVTYRYAVTR